LENKEEFEKWGLTCSSENWGERGSVREDLKEKDGGKRRRV
jgi:hypothetical protein